MKRPSLVQRLISKLRGEKGQKPAVAKPAQAPEGQQPKRSRTNSSCEPLEGRIAPAVLLNPNTVQYTDTNGDLVTIQFSKSLFKAGTVGLNDTLDSVFEFKNGGQVRTFEDGGRATDVDELVLLDISALAPIAQANAAEGTNLSITAEKQGVNGDGLVNVGYIKAATSSLFGTSLGKVVVEGDLGQIDAGNRAKSLGIVSLTVNSWGTLGTTTQTTGASLESNVTSGIGTLTVLGDFKDAILKVVDGNTSARNSGKINSLVILGNLTADAAGTTKDAGLISTAGNIGQVSISNIIGGGGDDTGRLNVLGKIGKLTLTGDLRGGAGDDSGQIVAAQGFTSVTLRDLWGGTGESSGRIVTNASLGSLTLHSISGHHTFGNTATGDSAATIAIGGNIGKATIAGNISGGEGDGSGTITAGGVLTKLTLGGHLIGGGGEGSGQIIGGDRIGTIFIQGAAQTYTSVINANGGAGVQEVQAMDLGDVLGVPGTFTLSYTIPGSETQTTAAISSDATAGQITAALEALEAIGAGGVTVVKQNGRIAITFTAEGDQPGVFTATATQAGLVGSTGSASGSIVSNGAISKVTIHDEGSQLRSLQSGQGAQSASISAAGSIGTIILNGDVDGTNTVVNIGGASITAGGNLKSLTVNGDLHGGDGEFTAAVSADGTIGTVKIFGSLLGGDGESSASITAGGKFTSALVTGSLDGGDGANSASLVAGADFTLPGDFTKVVVNGQLLGDGVDSASIRAGGKLGKVTVGTLVENEEGVIVFSDVLVGGEGSNSASIVGNRGATNITVLGHVRGGEGTYSASIQASGTLTALKVHGSLIGGDGNHSASVVAHDIPQTFTIIPGNLGKITIDGNVTGGTGNFSAQIRADGSIASVITGSISGNDGELSASIVAGSGDAAFLNEFKTIGTIGSIKVNGSITGGSGSGSGNINAGAKIGAITVNGHVSDTTFQTGRDFGSVVINGNLSDALVTAFGSAKPTAKSDLALAKLTVNGSVSDSVIRAGYDRFGNAANGNAQIGAVKVTSDWTRSSLVAGVVDVEGDGFGDADDTVIALGTISKIASILIGGNVTGTATDGDHFGFVAQTITTAKIGGVVQELTASKNTIDLAGTPVTDDTSIREVN